MNGRRLCGGRSSGFIASLAASAIGSTDRALLLDSDMEEGADVVTLQIGAAPTSSAVAAGQPDQRIIAECEWWVGRGSELAGFSAEVDVTRGRAFSITAAQRVRVYCRADATVTGSPQRVDGVAMRGGAPVEEPPTMSHRLVVPAGAPSAKVQIPRFAASVMAILADPTLLPNLSLRLYPKNGGAAEQIVVDPYTNGTPVTGGMEYVDLVLSAGGPVDATLHWELRL